LSELSTKRGILNPKPFGAHHPLNPLGELGLADGGEHFLFKEIKGRKFKYKG